MGTRGRARWFVAAIGGVFAIGGVTAWAAALAVFDPAITAFYQSWSEPGGANYGRLPADAMASLAPLGKEVRWAALLLALAGVLLLLRRSRWRGRVGTALAVTWVAADLLLDRLNPAGTGAAVAAGVGAAIMLAVGVLVGVRQPGEPPEYRRSAVVYSGGIGLAGAALLTPVTSPVVAFVPGSLFATAQAIGVALVVAAAVTATTATPIVPRSRAGVAAAVAVLLGGLVFVVDRQAASSGLEWQAYVVPVIIAVALLPFVCAGLSGGITRPARGGLTALLTLFFATPVLGVLLLYAAAFLAIVSNYYLMGVITGGRANIEGYLWLVPALFVGLCQGVLALLPWQIGDPDTAPDPAPAPAPTPA